MWLRAPATPMLWAPSAAPGRAPLSCQVFSNINTGERLDGKRFNAVNKADSWSTI